MKVFVLPAENLSSKVRYKTIHIETILQHLSGVKWYVGLVTLLNKITKLCCRELLICNNPEWTSASLLHHSYNM